MSKEQSSPYVPYKLGMELKLRGFNRPCTTFFGRETKEVHFLDQQHGIHVKHINTKCNNPNNDTITAPTYCQVAEWLREDFGIDTWIEPVNPEAGPERSFTGHVTNCWGLAGYGLNKDYNQAWMELIECIITLPSFIKKSDSYNSAPVNQ